jgi:Ca-activated chloride channel family protein
VNAFTFAHPAWLGAALLAVVAAELLRRRARPKPALPHAWSRWFVGLPATARTRAARWIPLARLLLLALVSVAAAGPTVTWRVQQEQRRGVDVMVALDTSSSMKITLPGSFASTRFDAARSAAQEFARGRTDDRIGLLAFARFARLRCPVTWDHRLFEAQLESTKTVAEGYEEDWTAIGVALAEAVHRLGEERTRTRVVVLVTDGVNNKGPISPEDAARFAHDQGVRVYTIALGAAQHFGDTLSPDEDLLRQIALTTGGRWFEARDRPALEDAWREIDALERAPIVTSAGLAPKPAASPLLAVALSAWLLLELVRRTWTRTLP